LKAFEQCNIECSLSIMGKLSSFLNAPFLVIFCLLLIRNGSGYTNRGVSRGAGYHTVHSVRGYSALLAGFGSPVSKVRVRVRVRVRVSVKVL
jgi:hypothetical protein